MRSTDENIELSKPVTDRFLSVVDHILDNRKAFKVNTVTELMERLAIPYAQYYALRNIDNRNVTLVNCIKLCQAFSISANWLLLGAGEQFMNKPEKPKKHVVKVTETAGSIQITVLK